MRERKEKVFWLWIWRALNKWTLTLDRFNQSNDIKLRELIWKINPSCASGVHCTHKVVLLPCANQAWSKMCLNNRIHIIIYMLAFKLSKRLRSAVAIEKKIVYVYHILMLPFFLVLLTPNYFKCIIVREIAMLVTFLVFSSCNFHNMLRILQTLAHLRA